MQEVCNRLATSLQIHSYPVYIPYLARIYPVFTPYLLRMKPSGDPSMQGVDREGDLGELVM